MLKLKQLLAHWANEGHNMNQANGANQGMVSGRKAISSDYSGRHESLEFKNPMNITLYNAVGGRIVKFHSYDRQTDQSNETTYIIPSDLDFEEELGKCITIEALKHSL